MNKRFIITLARIDELPVVASDFRDYRARLKQARDTFIATAVESLRRNTEITVRSTEISLDEGTAEIYLAIDTESDGKPIALFRRVGNAPKVVGGGHQHTVVRIPDKDSEPSNLGSDIFALLKRVAPGWLAKERERGFVKIAVRKARGEDPERIAFTIRIPAQQIEGAAKSVHAPKAADQSVPKPKKVKANK